MSRLVVVCVGSGGRGSYPKQSTYMYKQKKKLFLRLERYLHCSLSRLQGPDSMKKPSQHLKN